MYKKIASNKVFFLFYTEYSQLIFHLSWGQEEVEGKTLLD
jgi:hypothetical protein